MNKLSYGVDYLKFKLGYSVDNDNGYYSFPTCMNDNSFKLYLELQEILKLNFENSDEIINLKSWEEIRVFGNAKLYLKPCEKMTDSVYGVDYLIFEMSGEACREFERRGGNWGSLFNFITFNAPLTSFKRQDYCIDLFYPYFEQSEFCLKLLNGEFIRSHGSSSKFVDNVTAENVGKEDTLKDHLGDIRGSGLSCVGWSLTSGKHGSNQICIYNKAYEQYAKTKNKDMRKLYWVRIEFRFCDDGSEIIGREFTRLINENKIGDFYASLLYNKLKLINLNGQHNKSRCDIWKPWQEIINEIGRVQKLNFSYKSNSCSVPLQIYKSYNWLKNNVCKCLRTFYLISPIDFMIFLRFIIRGVDRESLGDMKKSEINSINEVRRSLGLNDLTLGDITDLLYENREVNEQISNNRLIKLLNSYFDEFEELRDSDYLDKEAYLRTLSYGALPF